MSVRAIQQLVQTSRRTFRLSKRLTASLLSELYSFWGSHNGGVTPFAFYNPFDVASGQQVGSNYDPTGNNTQGRVTVVFRGNWAQIIVIPAAFAALAALLVAELFSAPLSAPSESTIMT